MTRKEKEAFDIMYKNIVFSDRKEFINLKKGNPNEAYAVIPLEEIVVQIEKFIKIIKKTPKGENDGK